MSSRFASTGLSCAILFAACGGGSAYPSPTSSARVATAPVRTATVVVTTTATPAPGATSTPAESTATAAAATGLSGDSGIEGTVTIGPTCPVRRIESPCPDRPYEATIAILDTAGRQLTDVRSGADGHFRIALPPGEYTLVPQMTSMLPTAQEQSASVTAGAFTAVEIVFDSGIR